jgi:hypothetical protein
MGIVVFNPTAFKVRYPNFASVPDATLQFCFDDSGLYLSNSDASPVQNLQRREQLLWMLTAHISMLQGNLAADGQPLPVGRISQATEGSVNASLDYLPATPGSGAWFQQTPYGAQFWAATTSLRGFRYRPQPVIF